MFSFLKKALLIIFAIAFVTAFYQIKNPSASAQTPLPAPVCGTSSSDVVIDIDRSGSMTDPAGSSGTKLSNAKSAAKRFVDILAQDTRNRVGVVSFSTQSTIDQPLTGNYSAAKTQITEITVSGDTFSGCGAF